MSKKPGTDHDVGMTLITSSTRPVRLRAADPAQLVALLPYLFGFPPDESVIVLALSDNRVQAAARLDVTAADDPAALSARLAAVTAHGPYCVVIGWSADAARAEQAAQAVAAALGRAAQIIVVSGGRCRAGQGPWQPCPTTVPAAEQAGLTVLPSRAALAAQVAGPDSGDEAAAARWQAACADAAGRSLEWRRRRALALLRHGLDDPDAMTLPEKAEMAALVRDGAVRDALWPKLTRRKAHRQLAWWQAVVGAVPDEGAPAPLGWLAMAAWLDGQGALQSCCLERGLAIAPQHSLLRLAESINLLGLHPDAWARLRRSFPVAAPG